MFSDKNKELDRKFMRLAICEAEKASGKTSPNPNVGCVLVKNGRVISKGATQKNGVPHAEAFVLEKVIEDLSDTTLYVTLEPCSHYGKTPPCCDAVIKAGIKRVVIANLDISDKVSGKGLEKMIEAGINCEVGLLAEEALKINLPFFLSQKKKKPYITVKAAVSMDGKIALSNGTSKWITGETARRYAHLLRYRNDAVLVGANTVIWDDPELTCRIEGLEEFSPTRIVLDSELKISKMSKLVRDNKAKTIIYTRKDRPDECDSDNLDITKIALDSKGKLRMRDILNDISERGLNRLLVEGGGKVITSLLIAGLVDEIHVIKSPRIFGDDGLPFIGAMGLEEITRSMYYLASSEKLGEDIALIFKNRNTDQFASELIENISQAVS
jgi:diaminohydroxyphosphoribosylaminopyrimidine deaminase/5-amino-6-(5-phosphoribosylamino)uracil reductase